MENMLGGALAAVAGPLKDFAEKLAGSEGSSWLEAFKRFLRKEEPWPALVSSATRLLGYVTSAQVGGAKKFYAKKNFVVNTDPNAKVRIVWLGDNFKRHFLGKREVGIEGAVLKVHKLETVSLDAPIRAELGDRAEITLTHIWELLKGQPNGEKGVLLTNSYANIFYVRDAKGILWAVRMDWDGGGWRVDDRSVGCPGGWDAGGQVFSR